MTAFACTMIKRRVSNTTMDKKRWKMTRSQVGQVTKRIQTAGILREQKLLQQSTAINLLGTLSHKEEYVSKKKKENPTRTRKTKKTKDEGAMREKENEKETRENENEQEMSEKDLFVTFDLESTGLGTNTAQIIQIAAVPLGNCARPSFNRCLSRTIQPRLIF